MEVVREAVLLRVRQLEVDQPVVLLLQAAVLLLEAGHPVAELLLLLLECQVEVPRNQTEALEASS